MGRIGQFKIFVGAKDFRNNMRGFVGGVQVGIASDFDGLFETLKIPEGNHEIQLERDGHQSIELAVSVSRGVAYDIRGHMKRIEAA